MIATIRAIHTINDGEFKVPAQTQVWLIRTSLADAFNIPPHAIAYVNGEHIDENYCLLHNDTLEFVVGWSRKGADLPLTVLSTSLTACLMASFMSIFPGSVRPVSASVSNAERRLSIGQKSDESTIRKATRCFLV